MASLVIPSSGVVIGGLSKSSTPTTEAIGLSLPDAVIEEMIKCVQNGNPIQFSLGDSSSISYGSKIQRLGSPSNNSCTQEIFRTSAQNTVQPSSKSSIPHPAPNSFSGSRIESVLVATIGRCFSPSHPPDDQATASTSASGKKSKKSGTDAALAALQNSLATESMKKAENTVKYIKDGSLPVPGKRGTGKLTQKPKFLAQSRHVNEGNKSLPVSPSPKSASVPLSQQQAEYAKAARKPVIHLLAATPLTEAALQAKIPGSTEQELKQALEKVGDLNSATGKWELRKAFYKELDVWNFKFEKQSDRQKAIDNAVKVFDKMRLNVSEPQWEKLLARSERGTGKCLSKLQAQIAQASSQKAPKATESGRDSPHQGKDDGTGDKVATKLKGELTARTASQGSSTKTKKGISENEAQAKRLLSKKPPTKQSTAKAATKKAAVPKKTQTQGKNTKSESRVISSEYVQSSDDEDTPAFAVKATEQSKRRRESEETEASVQSRPLVKKLKKEPPKIHRVSDASQTSRTTSSSLFSTFSGKGVKSTSPRKSSPLASSPTNASDLDQSAGSQTSTSDSPPPSDVASRPPPAKRQKSSSAPSRRLRPEVTDLARKYKMFYPKYLELHQRITSMGNQRDRELEKDLLEMHARLDSMKREILAGIIDLDRG